jgi:protein farnesyltransferase subunit beta
LGLTRVIATFTLMQHPHGGFGGGHGHSAHSATSYAAVLSMVLVGGTEVLDLIDRKAMFVFFFLFFFLLSG